jgi:hypothetical protein
MVSSSHLLARQEGSMIERTLTERVEVLEQNVALLSELPAQVADLRSQFSQFREENRLEHLAIRQEIRDLGATLRREFRSDLDEVKRHSLVLHEHLVELIKTIKDK